MPEDLRLYLDQCMRLEVAEALRAEGLPGMTTEDSHGRERRSAPPANGRRWSALPPLICMLFPDHSSFSILRETPMAFAFGHFKRPKCYKKLTVPLPHTRLFSRASIRLFLGNEGLFYFFLEGEKGQQASTSYAQLQFISGSNT